MKNSIRLSAFASLFLLPTLLAAPAQAQDANWLMGNWEIDRESPRGTTTMTLAFREDADSIIGTMSMAMGQRDIALTMTEVRVDGMKVSFKMGPPAEGARGGRARAGGGAGTGGDAGAGGRAGGGGRGGASGGGLVDQTFTGELKGDVIQGTIATPRGEEPFTARRPSGESSGR